ncbi:MAG: hypothetical protein PVI23_01030 [Maricaulaceae bacterium]|jgi:hypothetical protein
MDKVIVERPRLGRSYKRPPGRSRPLEDEDGTPLRVQRAKGARVLKREKPLKTKSLNENLAPLFRYLDRQVGRPWDKVWSELSRELRPTSTVQEHVRDHVRDYVAIQTRAVDGGVEVTPKYGGPVPLKKSWSRLYVDPRTGILRRNPHWNSFRRRHKARKAEEARELKARMQVVDKTTQLHRLNDGSWWEVTLGPAPGERKGEVDPRWPAARVDRPDIDAQDVVLRAGLSNLPRWKLYNAYGVMAVEKRQLSRRDVKKRGLG